MKRDELEDLVVVLNEFLPGFQVAFMAQRRATRGDISPTEAMSAIRSFVRKSRERETRQQTEEVSKSVAKAMKDAEKRLRPLGKAE